MKESPKQEEHYGVDVWVNPTMEPMRREECLCTNCNNLKPGEVTNCQIASILYPLCVRDNIAMMITRCALWKPKT